MTFQPGSSYWIPDPLHGYLPGLLEQQNGNEYSFQTEEGSRTILMKDVGEMVDPSNLQGADDVAAMNAVSSASLLHTCRLRYAKDEIYTYVGKILIAINPFKAMPNTGMEYIDAYRKAADLRALPPHIYAIGAKALANFIETGQSQACLVAGESGAGKTESAKMIFRQLAESAAGGENVGIEQRILATNPILEAFGNAKTVRNNNSSRFGKWVQIMMTNSSKIHSADIIDYLLELTRVVGQNSGERGFHIFYFLASAMGDKFQIDNIETCGFLKNGQHQINGMNDTAEFKDVERACDNMNMTSEEQSTLWQMVAAVLHMGNVEFVEGDADGSKLADMKSAEIAAKFLGVDAQKLAESFCIKKLSIRGEITEKFLTPQQAVEARNAVAKLVYNHVFKWVVATLNQNLEAKGSEKSSGSFIGVLDIAGFESFEINSLEQLFINLSNEKLQQFFNIAVFKDELDDYEREGVKLLNFSFDDNQHILDMIEAGNGSILGMLDEEMRFPKANDDTFQARLVTHFGPMKKKDSAHPFVVTRPGKNVGAQFGVEHYAGPVTYTVAGFLEKNNDEAPIAAIELFQTSENPMSKYIAEKIAVPEGTKKKKKTVAMGFRSSLGDLMTKLTACEPHFVRCIKPNEEKKPSIFTAPMVMNQLKYAGVMEAIKIRQRGYPLRLPLQEFIRRYNIILTPKQRVSPEFKVTTDDSPDKLKEIIRKMFADFELSANQRKLTWPNEEEIWAVGLTKVFIKTVLQNVLEELRNLAFEAPAIMIQRIYKGYRAKQIFRKIIPTFKAINEFLAKFKTEKSGASSFDRHGRRGSVLGDNLNVGRELLATCDQLRFEHPVVTDLQDCVHTIESEHVVAKLARDLMSSVEKTDIWSCLEQARGLNMTGGVIEQLQQRYAKVEDQLPLFLALEEAVEQQDAAALKPLVEKCKNVEWLNDIWASMYSKACLMLEQLLTSGEVDEAALEEHAAELQKERGEAAPSTEAMERMSTARTVRNSVESGDVLDQLHYVAYLYDLNTMKKLMEVAAAKGLPEDSYAGPTKIFKNLHDDEWVANKFEEVFAQSTADPADSTHLMRLGNLAKVTTIFRTRQRTSDKARHGFADALHKHRTRTGRQNGSSILDQFPIDINMCPALKKHIRNETLTHHKFRIKEGLTQHLTARQEEAAIANFANLLVYSHENMGSTADLSAEIIELAARNAAMADEVYLQCINQTINNPNKESCSLTWMLLLGLANSVQPTSASEEYIRSYFRQKLLEDATNSPVPRNILEVFDAPFGDGQTSQVRLKKEVTDLQRQLQKMRSERDVLYKAVAKDQYVRDKTAADMETDDHWWSYLVCFSTGKHRPDTKPVIKGDYQADFVKPVDSTKAKDVSKAKSSAKTKSKATKAS